MDGMQPKTVRFGRMAHDLVQRESDRDGTSFSTYVREAALARAVWTIALRRDAPILATRLQGLREELEELGIDGMGLLERFAVELERSEGIEQRASSEPE